MFKFVISIATVCWLCSVADSQKNKGSTLELVHVLFRHGDRTPDRSTLYPNDPYINETFYPVGNGQLTNAGKRKEFYLGKFLRRRYGKRFLSNFTLEDVDARSTSYNRTKMSLQLVLASLFPPEGDHVWSQGIRWQPVPFNYWPFNEDFILGDPSVACAKYVKIFNEYVNSSEVKKMYENHTELVELIVSKTGEEMTVRKLAELYFTLTTEKENGLEIPEWARSIYPKLKTFAILDYNVSTATSSLKRLSSGYFVHKLIEDSKSKAKGLLPKTKIFLYSAHEFNLAYLMHFLGVYYPHVPPYGSSLIFELHKIKDQHFIKIFYENTLEGKLKSIKLPKCPLLCPLTKFHAIYKPLIPTSTKECFD